MPSFHNMIFTSSTNARDNKTKGFIRILRTDSEIVVVYRNWLKRESIVQFSHVIMQNIILFCKIQDQLTVFLI